MEWGNKVGRTSLIKKKCNGNCNHLSTKIEFSEVNREPGGLSILNEFSQVSGLQDGVTGTNMPPALVG